MRKYSGFFKRTQTWILTIAMLLSVVSPALSGIVLADSDTTVKTLTTGSVSAGEIVANNYDLTDAEKQLIGSGMLVGDEYTYIQPTTDDDLISVDSDNKLINAKVYTGADGYVWNPVSAKILVSGETKETVALNNGKGNYNYDGNAFSVVVDYQLKIKVSEDVQNLLLNAPAYLSQGLKNLEDIASVKDNLSLIEQGMPTFKTLTTTGISVSMFGQVITVKIGSEPAIAAVDAFEAQINNNNGSLDLTVMIDDYKNAASKVKYLADNGAAIKAKAEETLKYISDLRNDDFFYSIDLLGKDTAEYKTLSMVRSALDNTITTLTKVSEDAWNCNNAKLVKDGLTDIQYTALDVMVGALGTLTDVSKLSIKEELVAVVVPVQFNMSMFDVTVKVVLNVTDNSASDVALKEFGSVSTVLTLAEGSTDAEITEAVKASGFVAGALSNWNAYVDGKFEAKTSTLPATLTKDIEYVITYSPIYYNVSFAYGQTESLPYGYVVTFENNSDAEKAFDYTVTDEANTNGKYYPQGSSYVVISDATVERKVGKSYTNLDLFQLIADNYFTSAKSESILTSGAIIGNEEINVRYPDNNNKIVTLNGNVLTADAYDASYEGLAWVPYSYTLSTGVTGEFNGATSVEINEYFDYVTVTYRLTFTNFDDAKIFELLNLPTVLSEEAKAQLSALNTIANQKGNLETLNKTMVSILAGLIQNTVLNDDANKDAALKECFGSVLTSIDTECMGATNLYLFDIVSEYTSSSDGLKYYYTNSDRVIGEISKFAGYMNTMLGDDETLTSADKLGALERLIRSLPSNIVKPEMVDEYVGKLTSLETTFTSVVADLKAPNAAINVNSADLGKLTTALQMSGNTDSFAAMPEEKLHISDSSIVVVANNKVAITVNLIIEGGKNVTITSATVPSLEAIPADLINGIVAEINAKLAEQGIEAKYYETNYAEAQLLDLIGETANTVTANYEFTWNYKEFDVAVPNSETQTVTIKDLEIKLPASTDVAYRYDYYVDGVKVNGDSYTLTLAQLDKVIAGELDITVKEVFVLREDLVKYVDSLNAAVGNDLIVFALVENNGEFSIVVRIDAETPNALMGSVQGVAMGVVQGMYPYVGIDNNAFLDGGKVYLQTVVDALMNSGLDNDTILELMDAKGNINNMVIDGNIISNKPLTIVGGKLLETTMQLGTSSDAVNNVKFYVTLGSAPAQFLTIRNLIANELDGKLDFVLEDGKASIALQIPEKAYEAYLALLLVTNKIDLSDIDAVNGEIAVGFINEHLAPLFKDSNVTLATFENTLAKLGYNVDLNKKGVKELYDILASFYGNAEFTYGENSGMVDGIIDISAFIESMNIGVLADIIAEKDTGLSVKVDVSLKNLANDYEALFVDINAAGIVNKAGLVSNLSAKLPSIAGTSVIILLDDVNANLTFNKTTILNLNGFTVNGDITSNGNLVIVDGRCDGVNVGTVNGDVSGNVIITAGKYSSDVTAFIKDGYTQTNGVVANDFFAIVKDSNGNINVEINAGVLNTTAMPNVKAILVDLASQLIFNGYVCNYLSIDGCDVYDITLEDLVALYTSTGRLDTLVNEAIGMVDSAQLTTLVNTVLDDILDFAAISEAVNNDAPILSYDMLVKPWDFEILRVEEGDYLTVNIISGKEIEKTLNVVITGTDEDKALFADLMAELGETVNADINVNINHGLTDKNIGIEVELDGSLDADFTAPEYAVMFGVIIADGIGGDVADSLVAGIKEYYETGDNAALEAAFNALTTAQLITAIKNIDKNDEFADMVAALGLTDVVATEVNDLEAIYDNIAKLLAAVVRKAGISGGNNTLESTLNADGAYVFDKSDIEKLIKAGLFAGYSASANITITDVTVSIKLFADEELPVAPEFTGAPTIDSFDKIVDTKVILDGNYIIIDAHYEGITAEELLPLITFTATNADSIELALNDGNLASDSLVATGTKLTAIATNTESGLTASVEYTIIILGDINCNGETDVGDATLISRELVDLAQFDENQLLAADMNCNGETDIGDATKVSRKYVYWEEYTSSLNKN